MKKPMIIAAALLAILNTIPAVAQTKKFGLIGPLSGPLANIGRTVEQSAHLADEEFDKNAEVEFLFEDDQFNPRHTVTAFQKLVTVDKVAAVTCFGSSTCLSIADTAERMKVPLFAVGISDKLTAGRRFVFRHFPTARDQDAAIREEITRRQYNSIAVLAHTQDAMLNLRDLMALEPPTKVVLSQEILPGDSDQRALALRIKSLNPAAVYLLVLPPQLSAIAKQLRDIGYPGEFFGGAQVQQASELTAAQGALERIWFATADDTPSTAFIKRYEERYGEEPHPDGMHAFDTAKLLIELHRESDLIAAMKNKQEYSGIFGSYTLDAANTFVLPIVLKEARGNKFFKLQ